MMQRAAASKIENLRKSVSTARPPRFRRLIGLILAGHRVDCRTRGRSSHIRHLHFSMVRSARLCFSFLLLFFNLSLRILLSSHAHHAFHQSFHLVDFLFSPPPSLPELLSRAVTCPRSRGSACHSPAPRRRCPARDQRPHVASWPASPRASSRARPRRPRFFAMAVSATALSATKCLSSTRVRVRIEIDRAPASFHS